MEILRVENLSKIYGSGAAQVKAIDGVSFSVNRGEFIAVVGASGSGKSTLLHMIARRRPPHRRQGSLSKIPISISSVKPTWPYSAAGR